MSFLSNVKDWLAVKLGEGTTYAGIGIAVSWFFGILNLDVAPEAMVWLNDGIVWLGAGYLLWVNQNKPKK